MDPRVKPEDDKWWGAIPSHLACHSPASRLSFPFIPSVIPPHLICHSPASHLSFPGLTGESSLTSAAG